ncbi:MAG: hypothetical protein C5B49_00005, partial [Bdellovibrio sp.]
GSGGTIATNGTVVVTNGTVVVTCSNCATAPPTVAVVTPPSDNPNFPVAYVCSTIRSAMWGNLATAATVQVDLMDRNLHDACSFQSSTLSQYILQNKAFPSQILADNCPNIADGFYYMNVRDAARTPATTLIAVHIAPFGQLIEKMGTWHLLDQQIDFIADVNPMNMHQFTSIKCDLMASPLMVHLPTTPVPNEHLLLTPPSRGILFDILGESPENVDRSPKRISWNHNPNYKFIVLPNKSGRVDGIDEMFGENTKGPDGELALNGYDALAKYDGMSADGKTRIAKAKGRIDMNDPIYYELRLWADLNGDGVAQPEELVTLGSQGITSIDLHFDPSYGERDRFGNQARYKSVITTLDGQTHLLFDLWFRYLNK